VLGHNDMVITLPLLWLVDCAWVGLGEWLVGLVVLLPHNSSLVVMPFPV
jgi:hypothetical protein